MSINQEKNEILLDHYETQFYNYEHTNFYIKCNIIGPMIISVKNEDIFYYVYIRSILGFELIKIEEKAVMHQETVYLLKVALDQYFFRIFGENWIIKPESKIKKEKNAFFDFFTEEPKKEAKIYGVEEIKRQILINLAENEIYGSLNFLSKAIKIGKTASLCLSDKLITENEVVVKILKHSQTKLEDILGKNIKRTPICNIKQILALRKNKEPQKEVKLRTNIKEFEEKLKDFIISEYNYNYDLFLLINVFFKEIQEKNSLENENSYLKKVISNLKYLYEFTLKTFASFLNVILSYNSKDYCDNLADLIQNKTLFDKQIEDIFHLKDDYSYLLVKIFHKFDKCFENLIHYKNFFMQSLDYSDRIFDKNNLISWNISTNNILTWKSIFKKPQQKLFHYILFIEDFIKYLVDEPELFHFGLCLIEKMKDFLDKINEKKMLIDSLNESIKFKRKIRENDNLNCSEENVLVYKLKDIKNEKLIYALFTEYLLILLKNEEDFYEIIVREYYVNIVVLHISTNSVLLLIKEKEYEFLLEESKLNLFLDCFFILKNQLIFTNSNFNSLFFTNYKNKRIFYFVSDCENDSELFEAFFFTFIDDTEKKEFFLSKLIKNENLIEINKLEKENFNFLYKRNILLFHEIVIEEFYKNLKKYPFNENILVKFKINAEKIKYQKEEKLRSEVKEFFYFYNQISYEKFDFLLDYVHFYLLNCYNEKNFASRESLSIVKNTSEANFFKSLSNFTLKDVEYLLEGTKISQSKLSQLIFYEDLFLPHRNTVKEIYGYFSLQKEVKEDYLRRFKIEDLTSLIAYWFNQNIFTLFPSENFTFIRLALQNKTFFTFNDLKNLSYKSSDKFLQKYFDFMYEIDKFMKNECIFRLVDNFTNDYKTLGSFVKNILEGYKKEKSKIIQ
ncbi:hypothetical protein TUBRATIS_007800 [Tubulinosema ratisbonensis]|uniref:DH domain-containing protein n=1 Tax=Tubulinosema ratisbonensis TaxID=291195 RepID=A0A437ANF9_9MICR|nr:hypothetical protein TUBRATIS_007800 [Tubulinosema ratisbonensis]